MLPAGLLVIGKGAFGGCISLKTIILPDTLTTIGDEAFKESGLVSIIIPASVRVVGNGAFAMCSQLVYVEIQGENTVIHQDAFLDSPNVQLKYTFQK